MIQAMKIGVLGAGPAGRTLAKGFLGRGHPVMIGSRNPAQAGRNGASPRVARSGSARTPRLRRSPTWSCCRSSARPPRTFSAPRDLTAWPARSCWTPATPSTSPRAGRGCSWGPPTPSASASNDWCRARRVVKGLNIVLADVMVDPSLTGGEPDMFIAGDSDEAKQTVTTLLAEFGWPVVDLGGIESARWLEALSLAWVVYSHRTGRTHHAFKLDRQVTMGSVLSLEYRHVDVFSRHAFRGNGLVVVLDAAGLSTAVQQQLTREVRQFETVFVSGVDLTGRTARLRVFTEDEELGFAGHPVLGAASVLHSLLPATAVEQSWAVELGGRTLTARTRSRTGGLMCRWTRDRPSSDGS